MLAHVYVNAREDSSGIALKVETEITEYRMSDITITTSEIATFLLSQLIN